MERKKYLPKWLAWILLPGLMYVMLTSVLTLGIFIINIRWIVGDFIIDPIGVIAEYGIMLLFYYYVYKGTRYLIKYLEIIEKFKKLKSGNTINGSKKESIKKG